MDGAPKSGFEIVHATAIAMGDCAALIRGLSGAGKSDLALRCLALAPSAILPLAAGLIADDRVRLERTGAALTASSPPAIRGKLEVRGVGIISLPTVAAAEVRLVVDLVTTDEVVRMPDPDAHAFILDVRLARLQLAPFEASAPIKLLMALALCAGPAGEKSPCVASEPL